MTSIGPPGNIWWSTSTVWHGLALIVIPCVIAFGLEIYQVARNVPELRRSQALVAHTIDVIATTQLFERSIQEAERGQRGFLITGDNAYLDTYRIGAQNVSESLAKLKRLTANPEQQRRWPVLEQLSNIKLDLLKRAIDARQNEGFEAARQIIETNAGADAMRAIGQIIDAAAATENDQLISREELGDEAEQKTAIVSILAGIVLLIIVGMGALLVSTSFRRLSRSETALGESEDRFRGLLESAPDAMVVSNQDGTIIIVNVQTEKLFGYPREELLGKPIEVLVPTGLRDRHVRHRSACAVDAGARAMGAGLELFGKHKDGTEFPVEISLSPRQAPEGVLISSAIRDISERKAAEAALAQERAERERAEGILRQTHKMDVLGQLAGGIAHDFNNLLGVIISSLEILQCRIQTDEPRLHDPINTALYAAERSAVLTHQILAFSRQQPLDPRPMDANKLIVGMSRLLHQALGENIEIETVLAAGLWTIAADINQLENAILNLVVNARDAMAPGGRLTVETGNVYFDDAYANTHAQVRSGQFVMIAVSDTGMGMSQETIDKAFEPFFTTKERGHGTGLGLSQVYGFIKQSGGHVKIYSEVGEGTSVKMYLPRIVGKVIAPDELREFRAAPARQRSETILVVEDNELLLASVATMLREHAYRVLTATDAATALKLLESEPNINLLFTDIMLPGVINGRQLADEARRRRRDLLVLFTTGYARNAVIHHGRLDQGVQLIIKPFTYAALVAKIDQILARPE